MVLSVDESSSQFSDHIELIELMNTYSLQYGHLLFNNTNFWIKTCKMTIYKYPNQKVKKHKEDKKLEIFQLRDNFLMYRGMSICMADAIDEENFLAYKFHKNSDEIVLEEYRIRILDYFIRPVLFSDKMEYSERFARLSLRDGCLLEKSKIIKRNNHFLMIKGKYDQSKREENQQLDYTKPEKTYIYAYKGKIEAFNEEFLKIITYYCQKEKNVLSDEMETTLPRKEEPISGESKEFKSEQGDKSHNISNGTKPTEKLANHVKDKSLKISEKSGKSEFSTNNQNMNNNTQVNSTNKINSQQEKRDKKSRSNKLLQFDDRKVHSVRIYNRKISPIIDLDSLFVYKKHCLIQNVSFFDSHKKFRLAVTEDSLFLIFRDVIICKPKKNVVGANIKDMKYYTADKCLEQDDLSDMFFLLGLFFDWDIKMKKNHIFIRLFLTDGTKYVRLPNIENILIQLILMNYHKFVEPFLNEIFSFKIEDKNPNNQKKKDIQNKNIQNAESSDNLAHLTDRTKETRTAQSNIHNEIETMYCNLYRRLDDKNRKYLRKFNIKIQDVKNLYKIILHSPDLLPDFIGLAIDQKKEYFINELISFYKKQNFKNHLERIKMLLLKKNQFYLFSLIEENDTTVEISEILESEKNIIRAHYLRDVFSHKQK